MSRGLSLLVILLGASGVIHPQLSTEKGRVNSRPTADAAGRIVSFLKSFAPSDPGVYGTAEKLMGGLLDVYIYKKPADDSPFASFSDYVAARLRGTPLSGTSPEEAGRMLFALADETEARSGPATESREEDSDRTTREALALFVRYHARKILAGANLALFYQSADAAFLRTANSHAAAGLEIWERLTRLADRSNFPQEIFGRTDCSTWNESLVLVRHEVRRLEEVRQIFDRFGLFDLGLDCGPKIEPAHGPYGARYANAFALEHRFSPLDPGMTYARMRGYGWLDTAGISASAPIPLPDAFSAGSPFTDPMLPAGALYRDFIRGSNKSTLLVDLPDGDYQVTAIVANQPELALGSFQIRTIAAQDAPARAITYTAGETGDKSMNVRVTAGRLMLEFVPEPGENWLVNGLILTRRVPHIGHVPVFAAAAGSSTTVSAAITAPDSIIAADLRLSVNGRMFTVPMLPDGREFGAHLDWLPAWNGSEAAYFISARDGAGHDGRWPAAGAVRVHVK